MFEEYMQSNYNYPINGYQNTYGFDNYPYDYNLNRNIMYDFYEYYPMQNTRNYGVSNFEIEDMYPEIYKIIYPMVKKESLRAKRSISKEDIENMVNEIYSNLESDNNSILNSNAEVRGEKIDENRSSRRNNNIMDIIKILLLRELIGRPGCNRPNCRPGHNPPRPPYMDRPPFPRYDF